MDQEFIELDSVAKSDGGGAGQRVQEEIRNLALERNAWELDSQGYTVLTPDQVGPLAFAVQLRDRILQLSEEISGIPPDLETGQSHSNRTSLLGRAELIPDLMLRDRLFEQALMHPKILALITYLLGESCVVGAMQGTIKGPGKENIVIHTDQFGAPAPLPPYSQVANATWILTDYTKENGPTCIVPGSHKRSRPPLGNEATDLSYCVPIEAPAGSVLIWTGNTWHAAFGRTAPGLRVGILTYFARWYLLRGNNYGEKLTDEMLSRNPPRFETLLKGRNIDAALDFLTRSDQFA